MIILWKFRKHEMSHIIRKPVLCHMQTTKSYQLLCFRCLDSIIPTLAESKISTLWLASIAEQPGLSLTWSQTPEDRFSRDDSKNWHCGYCKHPKNLDTQNISCNYPKTGTGSFYYRAIGSKDADWMTNSVDPDQTALIWVYTVCLDLSVRNLRNIMVFDDNIWTVFHISP